MKQSEYKTKPGPKSKNKKCCTTKKDNLVKIKQTIRDINLTVCRYSTEEHKHAK